MNCNNFRELILTDYADGQLAAEQQQSLETHLKNCPACRSLAQSVKETAGALSELPRASLDREKIWQKIAAEIQEKKAPSTIYEPQRDVSFLEKFFPRLRPAYVGVSLFLAVLMTVIYGQLKPFNTVKMQEKEEEVLYLAQVIDEYEVADEMENDGFGTSIEDYFL